jgi:hypothetical protein
MKLFRRNKKPEIKKLAAKEKQWLFLKDRQDKFVEQHDE